MSKFTFPITGIVLSVLMTCAAVTAQTPSSLSNTANPESATVKTKYFHNVALDNGQTTEPIVDVRTYGSITGRVFSESSQIVETPGTERLGISGVKVVLRSAAPGASGVIGDRLTDERGNYDFPDLAPGAYTVEIDPVSIPSKYRMPDARPWTISVESQRRAFVELPVAPKRTINGIVYLDKDGDGQFKEGKDQPVVGAMITVGENLAISNARGWYILRDLPEGRIGILVQSPVKNENTHIVLDLGTGPVTSRVVNVPLVR